MRYKIVLVLLISLLGALRPINVSKYTEIIQPSWQVKVDPWLLERRDAGPLEFLVYLREQADLRDAGLIPAKTARRTYVYQHLAETARRTQAQLLAALQQRGLEYRPYWIANFIWVRGDADALQFIAARPEVAHIYPNPTIHLDLPPSLGPQAPAYPSTIQWNIQQVNAPQVWSAGVTGQGVVIAGQDTGYQWDHPALMNQYRGWDGSTADHNYNWHDAIHTGGVTACPANSPQPCDDNGHGTHTMGIMVGDDGQGNQIGVAPGARWIGCRNMNSGNGTPTTYSECFEWFLAPTDLNGANPRPDLSPDVINNSWSCPASEGCNWDSLKTVVENVRAAGILVVVSAGNNGPNCSTITTPASIYDASFTVGATDSSDQIASFSSRGPVTVDGSNRPKPDISAPGLSVYSSTKDNGYTSMSGTSMAAPHVAGLAALLISAKPDLGGRVDQLEQIITQSAVPLTTAQNCGTVLGSQVPNNTFGYGRIDAWASYQMAQINLSWTFLPIVR